MPTFRHSRALIFGLILVVLVAASSLSYTVKRGDTLSEIAADHGVSLSELIRANDISNPDMIHPGQVLTIPGSGGKADTTHVVSRGETLNWIAAKYKASVSNIVAANGISNPNLILIGQKILIPSGSGGSGGGSANASTQVDISDRTGQYHVVKRGETVEQIAAQYSGVSAEDIIRANGIVNGLIYAGSALYLGGHSHVAAGSDGSKTYTIKSGDRLGDIAHAYGVSVSRLVASNGISNPNLIRAGQKLSIPTGSAWVCPVKGARFRNDWGFPRGGGTRFHEGNDMFVGGGTPVVAPVSGTVTFKTGAIGGLQFRLEGKDGVVYIGTHMSDFGKEGKVSAGDVIGYVGNTGNAAGSPTHLHFGMYHKGEVVNPYPTLIKHGCK
jgi:LysM repeat protein